MTQPPTRVGLDEQLERIVSLNDSQTYQASLWSKDPVEWGQVVPVNEEIWPNGMFANQNSACQLRSRFTRDILYDAFFLDPES